MLFQGMFTAAKWSCGSPNHHAEDNHNGQLQNCFGTQFCKEFHRWSSWIWDREQNIQNDQSWMTGQTSFDSQEVQILHAAWPFVASELICWVQKHRSWWKKHHMVFLLSNPSNHVSRHLSWPDYLIRPERKKTTKNKTSYSTYSTRWQLHKKTSHDLKASASCDATRSAWTLAGLAREFRSLPQDVGSLLQGAGGWALSESPSWKNIQKTIIWLIWL